MTVVASAIQITDDCAAKPPLVPLPPLPRSTASIRIAREAMKDPILTKDVEIELVRRWKAGEEDAYTRLICAHLRMVPGLARRWTTHLPMRELCQAGFDGLVYAAQHFDPAMGNRFSTYVRWSILQAIRDAVAQSKSVVKISRQAITSGLFFTLRKLEEEVRIENPRMTDEEVFAKLAERAGVTTKEIRVTRSQVERGDVHIDASPEAYRRIEAICAEHEETPESIVARDQMRAKVGEILKSALNDLTPVQRQVIEARFFRSEEPILKDLGAEIGLSAERVRQIQMSAFQVLKKRIPRRLFEDFLSSKSQLGD